ncbi:hypothetical protein ANN_02304, partial [Periplaneta americana]
NLAPAELKKLRNKQRKARRKAELERQQAAQAQEKREQHNKSRQQGDAEPDAPQQDELVPEKLARNCTKVLQALRNEDFGSCPLQVADYEARCHVQFPYAQVFRPPSTTCQSSPNVESNHISDGKENCISN